MNMALLQLDELARDSFQNGRCNVVLEIIGVPDQPSLHDIKDITSKAVECFQMEHLMNFICTTITMSVQSQQEVTEKKLLAINRY